MRSALGAVAIVSFVSFASACTPQKKNVEAVTTGDAGMTTIAPIEPSAWPGEPTAAASSVAPRVEAPMPYRHDYAQLCPEVLELADAGSAASKPTPTPTPTAMSSAAPPAPRAGGLVVSARTRTRTKPGSSSGPATTEMVALVVAPSLGLEREVFSIPTGGDPYQCCTEATSDSLRVSCMFSGIDSIEGLAVARRDGDALVVRWCTGDLSNGSVLDHGEARKPLRSGAELRFVAPTPACNPRSLP